MVSHARLRWLYCQLHENLHFALKRFLSIVLAVILSGLLSASPSFATTSSWGAKSACTDFSGTGLLAHNNPVNGIDPSGHRQLSTTECYLHLTITDLKEVHRKHHPRERQPKHS